MRIVRARGRRQAAAAVVAVGLLAAALSAPPSAADPGLPELGRAAHAPTQDPEGGGGTSLKAEYDEIIGQEAELLARIDRSRAEQVRLKTELDQLEGDVAAKNLELVDAQLKLEQAEARAKDELAARRAADQKVKDSRERLRQQIVASYVSGGENAGVTEAILRADNGEDAGNALAYSRAIVGDSDALVRDLEEAQAERRRAEKASKKAKAQAQARRDDVGAAKAFLDGARDQQVKLVADVDAEVLEETDALNEVKGRKAKIEGEIANMNRTSDGVQQFLADFQAGQPEWKAGDLLITNPIPGYQIGSKFGQRVHPILGTARLHAGGDMGAPSGTVIYAPADGVVVLAGPRGGYGNATVIDHGFSLATLYGHQSRIDVTAGQFVKRGDPIGLVGSTGLSTGPHLHFETRLKGVPTDPEIIVDFTRPETSYEAEFEAQARLEQQQGGN